MMTPQERRRTTKGRIKSFSQCLEKEPLRDTPQFLNKTLNFILDLFETLEFELEELVVLEVYVRVKHPDLRGFDEINRPDSPPKGLPGLLTNKSYMSVPEVEALLPFRHFNPPSF